MCVSMSASTVRKHVSNHVFYSHAIVHGTPIMHWGVRVCVCVCARVCVCRKCERNVRFRFVWCPQLTDVCERRSVSAQLRVPGNLISKPKIADT